MANPARRIDWSKESKGSWDQWSKELESTWGLSTEELSSVRSKPEALYSVLSGKGFNDEQVNAKMMEIDKQFKAQDSNVSSTATRAGSVNREEDNYRSSQTRSTMGPSREQETTRNSNQTPRQGR